MKHHLADAALHLAFARPAVERAGGVVVSRGRRAPQLKRSWALQRTWGDADWHRDRIGRALGI